MSSPQILFGCSNVGVKYTSKAEVEELLKALSHGGVRRLDTAARYPPTSPGLSEQLLGEASAGDFATIDTKVLITGDGRGSLTDEAIGKSLARSYEFLKLSKINILYCHAPDKQTPIAEQAAAMDKYYRQGKFEHLGVSNFSVEMLKEWLEVAEENNYVKPSYFQGQYNLVCRAYEDHLFPLLRKHSIHFNAFSPLAGGFLTGKLTPDVPASALVGTRFEVSDSNPTGRMGRAWYDKPSMHEAIARLRAVAEAEGVPMEELAMRWLLHHSALTPEDGVIFGASRLAQAEKTMQTLGGGLLSKAAAEQLDGLWDICRKDAESIISY